MNLLRLLLVNLLLCIGSAQSGLADVAIIVRSDVPAEDLTFEEIRKLFMGDRQFWSSNLRVTLLIGAPGAHERDVFLRVCQMREAGFRQYWISKVFRAETSRTPKIVYSNEMAIDLVSAIPGAVASVESSQVPKGLKVLRINGRLPGEKGYPLH